MKFKKPIYITLLLLCLFSITSAQTQISALRTNKALYNPADTVFIDVTFSSGVSAGKLVMEYYQLNSIVRRDSVQSVTGSACQFFWIAPPRDFTGYLLTMTLIENGVPSDTNNIAIDISSSWKKFPRYGFLSKYPILAQSDANAIIDNLNRHHINGIQFYDWQWKHHKPLNGEPGAVAISWPNIANQTIYLSTMEKIFNACEIRGIKRMAYNLLNGAYANASADGVSDAWRMFSDVNHLSPDFHDLPSTWASDIYLMDYSNRNWVNYLNVQMQKIFLALRFDGWHIDQLGDRGTRYTYNGQVINMTGAFQTFIDTAKAFLKVPLVCNSVTNYAQNYIAKTDVDFLYTEVWSPYNKYSDLASLIFYNNGFSANTKNSVLAAYVNQAMGSSAGYFNTSSVMFTNAVIFASGGSHLELGEHMLSNPYFPNSSLAMRADLKANIVRYYDFLTAYENILRDSIGSYAVNAASDAYQVTAWPPQLGKIWAFSRAKNNLLILHVLNFTQASTLDWRDDAGIQTEPSLRENVRLIIPFKKTVKNIWYASPDNQLLTPQNIQYAAADSNITLTLPRLKYWSTVVVECKEIISGIGYSDAGPVNSFSLHQNYPNPFNPSTTISYSVGRKQNVSITIYDLLGRKISTVVNDEMQPGEYSLQFDSTAHQMASGIYLCQMKSDNAVLTNKMVLLK